MAGLFGNLWLARRLEQAEATTAAELARLYEQRHPGTAATIQVAGGIAAYAGAASPMTHALNLGMQGPMSMADLDALESFYRERGASFNIEVCPLADSSIFDLLGRREYRITEFNNVLVRTVDPPPPELTADVRPAEASEEDLWARTVSAGFFERFDFTTDELEMTSLLFHMSGGTPWFGFVDSVPAAAAAMSISEGLATFFGDSTIQEYRGHGLQTNLIRARQNRAAAAGCDLITASTLPGSPSQLNYERLGFRVVYTKMILTPG